MATNLAAYLFANFCEDAVVTSCPLGNIREVYCRRGSTASNNSKGRHVEGGSSEDEHTQTGLDGNASNVLIGNTPAKTNYLLVNCVRDKITSDLPTENCARDKRRRDLTSESREERRADLTLESCRRKDGSCPRGRSNKTETRRQEEIPIESVYNLNNAIVWNEGNVLLIDAGNFVANYFSVSDVFKMKRTLVSDRMTRGPVTEGPVSDRLTRGPVTEGRQVDGHKQENWCGDSRCYSNGDCHRMNPETSLGDSRNMSVFPESQNDSGVDNSVGGDPLRNSVGLMASSADTGRRDVIKSQRVCTGIEEERRREGNAVENSKRLLSSGTVTPLSTEYLNQCRPYPKIEQGFECSNRNGDVGVRNDSDHISRNCTLGYQDMMVSGNHCDGPELPAQSNVSNCKETKKDTSSTETIPPKDSENWTNREKGCIVQAPYEGVTIQEQGTTFHDRLFNEIDKFNSMLKDSPESDASIQDKQSIDKRDSLSSNLSQNLSNRGKQPIVECDSAKVNPLVDRPIDKIDRCDSSNSNSSDDDQGKLKRRGAILSQSSTLLSEQRDGEPNSVNNNVSTKSAKETPEDSKRSSYVKEYLSEDQIEDDESTFPSLVSSDSGVYTPVCESFRDECSFPTNFNLTETRMGNSDPEEYDSIQSELLFSLTESVDGSIASYNDFNNPMSGRIFRSGESGFPGGVLGAMSPGSDYWTRMCSGNVNLLSFGSDESIDRSEHDGHLVINENHASKQYASLQSNALRHLSVDSTENGEGSGLLQKDYGLPNATVSNDKISEQDSLLHKSLNPHIISGEKIDSVPLSEVSRIAERLSVAEGPQLTEDLKKAIRRAIELEQRQLEKKERRKIKRYEIHGKRDDEDVYEAIEEEISSNDEEEDIGNGKSLVMRIGGGVPGHSNPDTISNELIRPVKENHISNGLNLRCVGITEEVKQGCNNRAKIPTQPDTSGNSVRAEEKESNVEGIKHSIHTSINARDSRTTNVTIRVPEPDKSVPVPRNVASLNQTVPIPGNMASLIQVLKERGQKKRLPASGAEDKPSLLDDYLVIRNKISTLLSDVKDMSRTAQENRTGFSALQQRTNNISVERDGLMRLRDAVLHGS